MEMAGYASGISWRLLSSMCVSLIFDEGGEMWCGRHGSGATQDEHGLVLESVFLSGAVRTDRCAALRCG